MVSVSTSVLRIQSLFPIWFMGFSLSFPLVKVREMDEQGRQVLCVQHVQCMSRKTGSQRKGENR